LKTNFPTQADSLKYALVTAARNEEALIEQTILSVVAQTIRPVRWVIVSDGSTDGTDEIVKRHACKHDWIELLRMPEHRDRQFAAKAHCFNAGYSHLNGANFDIIGNLDADITFAPDYFEFLLGKFAAMPRLGVAGTPFVEDETKLDSHTYAHQFAQLEHVSGACQLFRRECFQQVGGYIPIKGGAIDWVAVTTARMKGWQTRTFTEKVCFHHRKLGTGNDHPLLVRFHYGQKAYYVGGHPLWEILRGIFEMREKPPVLGGLCFLCGFGWAAVKRIEQPISSELIAFHRAEQMARLRQAILHLGTIKRMTGPSNEDPQDSMGKESSDPRVRGHKDMGTNCATISVKGKAIAVRSTCIEGAVVVVTGKWLKSAAIQDEEWLPGEAVQDPASFMEELKHTDLKPDWFSFAQKFSDPKPRHRYHFEWDDVAAIPITTFSSWWEGLPQASRKNVRRAERRGVLVRTVEFDDELVAGIKDIYDETPIRQGRRFWHYGKPFGDVMRENSTYNDRSEFIAAYYGSELIGFIKMVYAGDAARIMQILSKDSHFDKRPGNALIAKAVEICAEKEVRHLVYGKYSYGKKRESPMMEFKRRNGFEQMLFPRYYIPLSLKGGLAIRLNLHLGAQSILPESLTNFLLRLRLKLYQITTLRSQQRQLPATSPRQALQNSTAPVDAVSKTRCR
jgi:glycosyltransferase involved in cell wall biosynthesis